MAWRWLGNHDYLRAKAQSVAAPAHAMKVHHL